MSLTMTEINKLDKSIDKSMEKYFCSKCNTFHKRKYEKKGLNQTFFNHFSFKINISSTQIWKLQFKKSWNKYSQKEHRKSIKSSKQ